ncbi:CHAD domain-containing protein [Lutimaribacter marinistellae]|uniref:CHAD domain-containing protein n=1 Tax=Lutimaribacter marinistellae TaxID=1820329 RepID=A0ABV7TN42_9RHOB
MSARQEMLVVPGRIEAGKIWSDNGLRLLLEPLKDEGGFVLLDDFDQSLQKSGRALLEIGGELLLFAADGSVYDQATKASGGFVAEMTPGPVRKRLGDISPLRALLEVASGTAQSQQAALLDDEDKTQARAAIRVLSAAEGEVTLVTVELMRGYDKAFETLRASLIARGATAQTGTIASKLAPSLKPYVSKPAIPLDAGQTAHDVAVTIIRAYLEVARRNEAGTIADHDTEFLHDYRVALRKIRSVLSLFKGVFPHEQTVHLKSAFSELMAPTGPLRDLDVYLLEKDAYFELLPDSLHRGLRDMFRTYQKERDAAQQRIARRFRSKAYADRMAELEQAFSEEDLSRGDKADLPAAQYARALIWKRYRKVCKIARAIDDSTPDEEVHELRISCKKLRYLIEFFAPLFAAEDLAKVLKPLKKLQDNLGLFNDYSVQQEALRSFVKTHRSRDRATDTEVALAVGGLITVLHKRQLDERALVTARFKQFDSDEVRETARTLFHVTEG